MKKSRLFALLLSVCMIGTSVPNAAVFGAEADYRAETVTRATGLHVDYHTPSEIKAMAEKLVYKTNEYEVEPSKTQPYNPGKLSAETRHNALKTLNFIRYVAGIPYNVQADEGYEKKAQAAAYLNMLNNRLSHYPARPAGMDDALYKLGYSGAGESNLGSGYFNNLTDMLKDGWMADSSSSNIRDVGHRRWCLNPEMKKTGFGAAGAYSAMYAFDGAFPQSRYKGVAWPAQNMPLEFFGNGTDTSLPWSISMGRLISTATVGQRVQMTLERERDGRVWKFDSRPSAPSDGDFYVSNLDVGQKGCIIFRPYDIEGYEDGDVFHVTIYVGEKLEAAYDVNFFQMHKHTGGTATCTRKATCSICWKEYGELAPHRYVKHTIKASCYEEGVEYEKCEVCRREKEGSRKKLPKVPHEYFDEISRKAKVSDVPGESYNGSMLRLCGMCMDFDGGWRTIYTADRIEFSQDSFIYNGSVQKPEVVVKDRRNEVIPSSNYTVSFQGNCTDVGTHKAVVTFRGEYYEGSFSAEFKIAEKEKKSVHISMMKSDTRIYIDTIKSLGIKTDTPCTFTFETSDSRVATVKSGKVTTLKPGTAKITVTAKPKSGDYKTTSKSIYINVVPAKPATPSVIRSTKSIKMTVKKPKGAFAYQYQYATNSNMSNAVTVNEKATSYKFAATPTKNYYVRVRSFARANGKTYYSGWTTVKKVNKVK